MTGVLFSTLAGVVLILAWSVFALAHLLREEQRMLKQAQEALIRMSGTPAAREELTTHAAPFRFPTRKALRDLMRQHNTAQKKRDALAGAIEKSKEAQNAQSR